MHNRAAQNTLSIGQKCSDPATAAAIMPAFGAGTREFAS
jgi:hypothetical protein